MSASMSTDTLESCSVTSAKWRREFVCVWPGQLGDEWDMMMVTISVDALEVAAACIRMSPKEEQRMLRSSHIWKRVIANKSDIRSLPPYR